MTLGFLKILLKNKQISKQTENLSIFVSVLPFSLQNGQPLSFWIMLPQLGYSCFGKVQSLGNQILAGWISNIY